jgi:Xaa-Pro aminopeptidase
MHTIRKPAPLDFAGNRQRLLEKLSEDSLAIVCSGRPSARTADQKHDHFADRSFFYLCGIEQEESILVIYRDGEYHRVSLFISQPDEFQERWNGRRMSKDEIAAISGIEEIYYLDAFEGQVADLIDSNPINRIWLDFSAVNSQAQEIRHKLQEIQQRLTGRNKLFDLSPLLTQLRMVKSREEIGLIKSAINLTGEGIFAMLRVLKPGLSEYHLWSEFQYTLSQAGCLTPAFPSIVAAGRNLFCLHHMKPFGGIGENDLVQVDVGATAGGLCADISRVLPASGRFSERQLQIYNLVRACQETAFSTIRPGIKLSDINQACRETAAEGLKQLGILSDRSDIGRYFWHGVSHHLGLDVHDVSHREALLLPGMVLTVEPGIYIPELNIGMRIEDDIEVVDDGCHILSAGIPREAKEIEALMS